MTRKNFVRLPNIGTGGPFQHQGEHLAFVPREGVTVDYGLCFDPESGYRCFFCYADTPNLKNTMAPDSVRNFANAMEGRSDDHKLWRAIFYKEAALAETMNAKWIKAGRPSNGVEFPKETMQ